MRVDPHHLPDFTGTYASSQWTLQRYYYYYSQEAGSLTVNTVSQVSFESGNYGTDNPGSIWWEIWVPVKTLFQFYISASTNDVNYSWDPPIWGTGSGGYIQTYSGARWVLYTHDGGDYYSFG